MILKSASTSGVIMTKCMIKSEFFERGSYQIEIKNGMKSLIDPSNPSQAEKPLIEFCLPI